MRDVKRFFLHSALFIVSLPTIAQNMVATSSELALLPDYCKYAQTEQFGGESSTSPSPGAKKYVAKFGESHWHNHHYCWGQLRLLRSYRANITKTERDFELSRAVAEADYMIQNSDKQYVLLPEIYTFRGNVLMRLKKHTEALASFDSAIAMSKTYAPPYLRKIEYFKAAGDKVRAMEVAEQARKNGVTAEVLDKSLEAK